jgi:hypothetical protein
VKVEVEGFSFWFPDDPRSFGAQRSREEGGERRIVSVGRTFGIGDIFADLGAIGPI